MGEEKQPGSEKKFAAMTSESIRVFAEAVGFPDLSEEVTALLAEDVSYRVREIAQTSCQFTQHSRRRRLTVEDVNKALRCSNVQVVHGHGAGDASSTFRATRDGDLFFPEDKDVNLAAVAGVDIEPPNPGQVTVKAHWLSIEGQTKGSNSDQGNAVNSKPTQLISEDLLMYYENVTRAIIGADEELMKLALMDVSTNGKIAPLLQHFVLFIANGVKTLSHDIVQLTKLLHTVRALINNRSLYLEPRPYLQLLMQGVMYCLVEPLAASINPTNDHWALRDYAARLLSQLISNWGSAVNQLREMTVSSLKDVLHDPAKPFCSHYGAVKGLVALGPKAVEEVILPYLPTYWPHLQTVMEDISYANAQLKEDAHKVYGALLRSAELMICSITEVLTKETDTESNPHNEITLTTKPAFENTVSACPLTSIIKQESSSSQDSTMPGLYKELAAQLSRDPFRPSPEKPPKITSTYQMLYDYFGDALVMRHPVEHVKIIHHPRRNLASKLEQTVVLSDQDSKKTGEELLDIILSAPDPEPIKMEVEEELPSVKSEDISEKSEYEQSEEQSDIHSDPSLDRKSELSVGQNGDDYDVDIDNGDHVIMERHDSVNELDEDFEPEPDAKSEKSERSFRSDKSDENSYIGEDSQIKVKTVNESDSQGIKLKITFKRKKGKDTDSSSQPAESPTPTAYDRYDFSQNELYEQQLQRHKSEGKKGRKRKTSSAVYNREESGKKQKFECVPSQSGMLKLKIKGAGSGSEKHDSWKRASSSSESSDDDTPLTKLSLKMPNYSL